MQEMQKKAKGKGNRVLVEKKQEVLGILNMLASTPLATLVDTTVMETRAATELEAVTLQTNDDWNARLTIKKKNTNPPEYHFSDDERALAQRAHERLLAIVAVATYYRRVNQTATELEVLWLGS